MQRSDLRAPPPCAQERLEAQGPRAVSHELARSHGRPAYLVDSVREIPEGAFSGTETVLVTAGASAPEDTVEECVSYLRGRYGAAVESRTVREEHVSFPLPRELRVLAPGGR